MNCPFDISFHHTTGGVEELILKNDSSNFQFTRKGFGVPIGMNYLDKQEKVDDTLVLSYLYFNDIQLTVARTPSEIGLTERYTFKNNSQKPITLNKDEYGIEMSFTDGADIFEVALNRRLYVRVFHGTNTCIYTSRTTGGTAIGLVVVDGELGGFTKDKYSKYSDTIYIFYLKEIELLPDEEYSFEWIIFPHNGIDDFRQFIGKYMPIPYFSTLTPSIGERVEVSSASVSLNGIESNSFIAREGEEIRILLKKEIYADESEKGEGLDSVPGLEGARISNSLCEKNTDFVAETATESVSDSNKALEHDISTSNTKEDILPIGECNSEVQAFDNRYYIDIILSPLDVLKMKRDSYKRSIFNWKNPFDYLIRVRDVLSGNNGEKGLQEAAAILHEYYRGVGKNRYDCFIPIEVIKYDYALQEIVHDKCRKLLDKQKGLLTPYRLLASYEYLLMEKELSKDSPKSDIDNQSDYAERNSNSTENQENSNVESLYDQKLKEYEELCNHFLDTPFGRISPKSNILTYIIV